MLISTTIGNHSDHFGEEAALRMLKEAGFDAVDYSMFSPTVWNAYKGSDYLKHAEYICKVGEKEGIAFGQVHAPFPSFVNKPAEDEAIFETLVKAIRVTAALGAPYVVVHPPIYAENRYDSMKAENKALTLDLYGRLLPVLEECRVQLGVENMFNWDPLRKRICPTVCSTWQEMAEIVDELGPCFVNCLDIGHGYLTGDTPANMARHLGKRVKLLHVQDVDGIRDLHTMPFMALNKWDDVCAALAEIDYDGTFSLEADGFLAGFPEELYPAASKLMAQTARYLADRITSLKK